MAHIGQGTLASAFAEHFEVQKGAVRRALGIAFVPSLAVGLILVLVGVVGGNVANGAVLGGAAFFLLFFLLIPIAAAVHYVGVSRVRAFERRLGSGTASIARIEVRGNEVGRRTGFSGFVMNWLYRTTTTAWVYTASSEQFVLRLSNETAEKLHKAHPS